MTKIRNYRFKHIEIDEHTYTTDVIIHPEKVVDNWWRKSGHELIPEDLKQYIPELPEVLIIGTGKYGRMQVPDATKSWLENKGVVVKILKTDEACNAYNQSDEPKTGAALHLTC